MEEEFLDVLGENGEKTGISKSYIEVHEKGLIHRAVHIWIISNNKVLIQKRNADRRFYPNYWDISAAGHVSSGETSLEAAKKEVKEELGINLIDADFRFIGEVRESFTNGKWINREYDDIYICKLNIDINDIKISHIEVEEVKFLSTNEFKDWIEGKGEKMVPHQEYKMVLDYI